jgi:hypothetical protein
LFVDCHPMKLKRSVSTLRKGRALLWIVVGAFLAFATPARAAFTFLGPTPYSSAADSPFPVDGSNPNYFLEDLEDGQLNSIGIFQRNLEPPLLGSTVGVILSPGALTDSVDGDDGIIDGAGHQGFSMRSALHLVAPTAPPFNQFVMAFEFDSVQLGRFPHAFGFVWTDGETGSSLTLQILTGDGEWIESPPLTGLGDGLRDGGAADDRFVGAEVDDGIQLVRILGGFIGESAAFDYFEIDHIQYGFSVPEPTQSRILISILAFFVLTWRDPLCGGARTHSNRLRHA